MTLIELAEGGEPREVRLSVLDGQLLSRSRLVTAVPSAGSSDWWLVGPAAKVGVAHIGDVEIRVQPKIPIQRLFFLLGYARDGRWWRPEEVDVGHASDLLDAMAEAFVRQADRALAQGLLQGYRTTDEASPVLKGRLRESDQMRRQFGLAIPLEVRLDDYTIDIPENQLLRAATRRLLRLPGVGRPTRTRLLRLNARLADISPHPPVTKARSWRPTRLNARYHGALGLAELILRSASVEHLEGGTTVNAFMIDMPVLFEDFVTRAMSEAMAPIGGRTVAQDRWTLDEDAAIRIKPDLVWYRSDDSPGAVMDAKYKAEKPSGSPDADLYQMLAYCTALRLNRGHLVYAKGNESAQRHRVHNVDVEIVQHALDLDQEPDKLLADVRGVVVGILEGARVRTSTGQLNDHDYRLARPRVKSLEAQSPSARSHSNSLPSTK